MADGARCKRHLPYATSANSSTRHAHRFQFPSTRQRLHARPGRRLNVCNTHHAPTSCCVRQGTWLRGYMRVPPSFLSKRPWKSNANRLRWMVANQSSDHNPARTAPHMQRWDVPQRWRELTCYTTTGRLPGMHPPWPAAQRQPCRQRSAPTCIRLMVVAYSRTPWG